jgi:hypothetical protein
VPERPGSPGGAATVDSVEHRRFGGVVLAGVAASSASGLAFEIALTRVFAVTQFYHFAFLSVSLALLGFGASGSILTAFPALARGGPRRWAWFAAAQAATSVGALAVVNLLPFDSFAIAWDRRQILYLAVYYVALAVPFLFGGLVIAVLLSAATVSSHRVYAASLSGSGVGAGLALISLDRLGAEGSIVLAAAIAMGAAAAFGSISAIRLPWRVAVTLAAALLLVGALMVPEPLAMNLSPYKGLASALRYPGAHVVETIWERGTRIDLIRSEGIRSLPGLSLTYTGPPPEQDGLTFDGDDLSPVPRTLAPEAEFATHLLAGLAFELRPGAEAMILGPRGGLDVLVALAAGATSVTAVEPHGAAVDAVRRTGTTVYDDARISLHSTQPRTFVERTADRFDVIDVALTAPYRPVASGAYSLAEDYRMTVEAFEQYLSRLAPDGILSVARWVQTPPSEETRLVATAAAALRRQEEDPGSAIVMLRGYSMALLLVQPDGFDAMDLELIHRFADRERFDLMAAPGLDPATTNRFNVVPDEQYSALAMEIIAAADPKAIYGAHPFDIAPATDDHPFFGHYFTWSQTSAVLDTLGRTWQPFGGAGFFVLFALLAISTVAALTLITAPLLIGRRDRPSTAASLRWWTVGYFAVLGVAFLFVEIPLLQQYILIVGHPAVAFAAVLFAILVASGIGSAISPRIPWRAGAVALALGAASYPFLVRWLTPAVLPLGPVLRIVVCVTMIAPLGLAMGIMFPLGLAHLERAAPQLVPWAWAINGTVSVVGAAAAAILALAAGFSFVVRLGALAYAAAALLARPSAATRVGLIPPRG